MIYWFSLERRAERQQERSIRAGDVHSFASAATLPVPEHRADSHDLHRAGSSALQLSGGDTPVERMRLSSLLVDALASSAGAAPARPSLTLNHPRWATRAPNAALTCVQ